MRWILAKGIRANLAEGVFEVRAYLGRDEAAVIYREDAQRVLVITVEWVE